MLNLRFPPVGHPAREGLDVDALSAFGSLGELVESGRVRDFRSSLWAARDAMAAEPGIASITALTIRASDAVDLVRFGRRGGVKRVWRLAKPHPSCGPDQY